MQNLYDIQEIYSKRNKKVVTDSLLSREGTDGNENISEYLTSGKVNHDFDNNDNIRNEKINVNDKNTNKIDKTIISKLPLEDQLMLKHQSSKEEIEIIIDKKLNEFDSSFEENLTDRQKIMELVI